MTEARWNERPVRGSFEDPAREAFLSEGGALRVARIDGVDRLRPFLTTLASGSDHWAFVSSTGALTAGRRSPETALFPYRTVDRLHDAQGRVGGRTIVRAADGSVWEPFTEASIGRGAGARDAWRSIERCWLGSAVTLVERDEDLGLELRQTWTSSERHGLVRVVTLANVGGVDRALRVVDGVLDVLPASVPHGMLDTLSSLVDAYRMSELVDGVGVFGMGSIPVDRAEPSEALRATTAWCSAAGTRLLSAEQFETFRRGGLVETEHRSRGLRSGFLVERELGLAPGESATWTFAFELEQAADEVERLLAWQLDEPHPAEDVARGVRENRAVLESLVAAADGTQSTASAAEDARHAANTLYNVLRGGVFPGGHEQRREDLLVHLPPLVRARAADPIAAWPETWRAGEQVAEAESDPDLERHLREFLPLAFGRRHGDPSRPWNHFSIDVRRPDGELRLAYQGNWRDVFQNWEALGLSHPAYLQAFVVRFLNASTADGYNPYRISESGVDWEALDPDDPWSYIGYWGDHQIVYLTRLIDRCEERSPGRLAGLLGRPIFVHADVPYRIRSYDDLVRDPRSAIDFDFERDHAARERVEREGKDGLLVHGSDGQLVRATLEEKLLVPFLVKLTNLVPGAGIWMNTQRPEWNDANNALVGAGASVVTVCALWRHAAVLAELLSNAAELRLAARTRALVADLTEAMGAHDAARATADPAARGAAVEALGRAGERHRAAVYADAEDALGPLPARAALDLLERASEWLRATVDACRRDDGLFHSYDLVAFDADGDVAIRRLPLMLEGQVAVLSAGLVDGVDAVAMLEGLRASPLYRADQRSYLLYPDRDLPGLLDRGVLPAGAAERAPVLTSLVEAGHGGIVRAADEGLRFAPDLRSIADLDVEIEMAVSRQGALATAVARDADALRELYRETFDHEAFTGRSGTFFGYEGLGCIYWHMVSKLVLAVQETVWRAVDAGEDADVVDALVARYRDVRAGLGTHRTPEEYGAFPSEPYSHTPGDGGARQPGMTGQVKEDLLARLGELGVRVRGGRITFDPTLFDPEELRAEEGSLAFTHCGVEFVVSAGEAPRIVVHGTEGHASTVEDLALDRATSAAVWSRTGAVKRIEAALPMEARPR
ncbi:MAG: hypothetical protein AAGB93_15175 [Planctomycetota bacterium]